MKGVLAGFVLIATSLCQAETRVNLGLGAGDVDIPEGVILNSPAVGDDALALSLYVGHTFDSGVIVDLGFTSLTDDVFFGANDNVRFGAIEALIGYRLNLNNVYLEPKVGYARWRREVEEGEFLNPGSEARVSDNGGDPLYMLTGGYRLSDSFSLSLSYRYQELSDDKADTVLLGFGFPF